MVNNLTGHLLSPGSQDFLIHDTNLEFRNPKCVLAFHNSQFLPATTPGIARLQPRRAGEI
jgi:hypothetical protein